MPSATREIIDPQIVSAARAVMASAPAQPICPYRSGGVGDRRGC
jgi:hypothetical protein